MRGQKDWKVWLCLLLGLLFINWLIGGRPHFRGFQEAKRVLAEKVVYDHPLTLYCQAEFDSEKNLELPAGFRLPKSTQKAEKMTWEHVVPVAKFGRTFKEWQEGHPECVHNGKPYKGRKCAAKINDEFMLMEGDMYNLFPSIDVVNAARGSREYAELSNGEPVFGSCGVRLRAKTMEPPEPAKGPVARASLYMAEQYRQHLHWEQRQRELFEKWNKRYPVQKWECVRAKRIERLQGNANRFVREPCEKAGLW